MLRKAFLGSLLAINTLTAVNSGIVAHDYVHNDLMNSNNPDKLIMTFGTATLGSFVAMAYPAIDWQSGTEPSYASDGDTPISIIAENTPDILQIPGGIASILGAPGSAVGNFSGSVIGFFDPY